MKFGIYRIDDLLNEQNLVRIERKINAPLSFISVFRAWNRCAIEDDILWLTELMASRREILLTWEPWLIPADPVRPELQPDFSLRAIGSGKYDVYIRSFATVIKGFPRPIYLRPLHEMNGFWYPWCGTVNRNDPDEFRPVWRRLRRLFAEVGALNVRWVWSPFAKSHPPTSANKIEQYFPGDDAVDVLALDGYNWGKCPSWGVWQDFSELFGTGYDSVTSLSEKPVIIAETASASEGGSKARWIRKMASVLPSRFPRVETLIWFDTNKECDWRIASSSRSLEAFREVAPALFDVGIDPGSQ